MTESGSNRDFSEFRLSKREVTHSGFLATLQFVRSRILNSEDTDSNKSVVLLQIFDGLSYEKPVSEEDIYIRKECIRQALSVARECNLSHVELDATSQIGRSSVSPVQTVTDKIISDVDFQREAGFTVFKTPTFVNRSHKELRDKRMFYMLRFQKA